MATQATLCDDLNAVATFLSQRDVATLEEVQADVLALIGSSLIGSIRVAAEIYQRGGTSTILVSGGIGHSTQHLRDHVLSHSEFASIAVEGRAEADIMRDILVLGLEVPPADVIVENQSTNCGANAQESRFTLEARGIAPKSLAIIQDPTMQRRTHQSFIRAWRGITAPQFINFAPFVPRVRGNGHGELSLEPVGDPIWSMERFVSLLVGEIARLRDDENGYGPAGKGFIDHVDIPPEVESAYLRITTELGQSTRVATS